MFLFGCLQTVCSIIFPLPVTPQRKIFSFHPLFLHHVITKTNKDTKAWQEADQDNQSLYKCYEIICETIKMFDRTALVKSEIPSAKIWEHSLDVLQLFISYGVLVLRVVVVLTLILEDQEKEVFGKWFMRFHQQTHQPWQPDDHPTLESRKELPKHYFMNRHFISWKRETLHKTYVTVQSILKIKSFQLYTKMPFITLYKTPYKSKSESFKRQ